MSSSSVVTACEAMACTQTRGITKLNFSYKTHNGWLSQAVISGKEAFIKSQSRPLNDLTNACAGGDGSGKKKKRTRDREQSMMPTDRASIAAALADDDYEESDLGGNEQSSQSSNMDCTDDTMESMDFTASTDTDGFGVPLPKTNAKRNTILPNVLDPSAMKVSELRAELRSRSLNAQGLKKDLQRRLEAVLAKEIDELKKMREQQESRVAMAPPSSKKIRKELASHATSQHAPSHATSQHAPSHATSQHAPSQATAPMTAPDPRMAASAAVRAALHNDEMEIDMPLPVKAPKEAPVQPAAEPAAAPAAAPEIKVEEKTAALPPPPLQPKLHKRSISNSSSASSQAQETESERTERMQREVKLRMDRDKQQKNAVKKKETTSVLGKMLGPITQMFSPGGSKKKTNGWAERDSGDTSSGGSSGADKIAAALPPPAAAAIAIVANPAMKKKMDLQAKMLKLKQAEEKRREAQKAKLAGGAGLPVAATAIPSLSNKAAAPATSAAASTSSSLSLEERRKEENRKNQAAQEEARKARMAKVAAQMVAGVPATPLVPTSSSSTGSTGSSTNSVKSLEDQVAEKRAAMATAKVEREQLNTVVLDEARAKAEKQKAMVAAMREKAAAAAKPIVPSVPAPATAASALLAHAQQQLHGAPQKVNAPQPQHAAAPTCEDNYEMSDREGSDDESDSEEENAPRKRVPDWARSVNLIPALERQFCDADLRIDPDSIFPEVQTCDLEDIFEQKKTRYNRRTSSGNWSKDQLSNNEKVSYRRDMGY